VAHDGDTRLDDGLDGACAALAALELDRLGLALLHQPAGVGQRLLRGDLVGHEGQIDGEVGALQPSRHAGSVVDHVFEGDAQGVGVALDHHAQAVTHQHHVHPGRVGQAGHGVVIGGDHHDFLVVGLHAQKVRDRLLGHALVLLVTSVAPG